MRPMSENPPQALAGSTAPASALQEQYWLLDRLNPSSPAYNVVSALTIRGEMDRRLLEDSLNRVVARHEILRTRLREVNGELVQVIGDGTRVAIGFEEVPTASEKAGSALEEAIQREVRRPFDLAAGPLVRVNLFRCAPEEHVLVITRHHSVVDLASEREFAREWSKFYSEGATGVESALPAPTQYADFTRWQKTWMESEECRSQIASWKKRLDGYPDLLEMPLDFPRPARQAAMGAVEPIELPAELVRRLQAFSQAEGISLILTVLTGYFALLHRYSGQAAVTVGVPFPNRRRPEFRAALGCMMNILPVPADLSGNPSFREAARRVTRSMLESSRAQEVPLTSIVAAVRPVRDTSRDPLFQAGFTFRTPMALDLPGLETVHFPVHNGGAQLDLFATLWEDGGAVRGTLEYDTALFTAETVRRIASHLRELLSSAVAEPERPIGELQILAEEDTRRFAAWNDTRVDYPRGRLLHEFFEDQARRTPDAVAVEFEERHLTYAELNARANQLAHYLRGAGAGAETLVAVCMERSLELVIALYGVLKAGAAYVPVDPDYPAERVAFMLEDAGAPVLLTARALLDRLPPHGGATVCLDADWERISAESDANPPAAAREDNLAYVIYTSGSTGKPKGAMNTHRGICNRLLWMQDRYQLNGGDRVLQKTPFSFDVSVWEFFWPLLAGARLVVARPGGHRDPRYLVRLIQDRRITVMHFVPPMLQIFLEEPGAAECRSLRHVICSGEALPYELQERFFALLRAELHNLYGPTEAAVDVTHWTCRRNGARKIVPIGRPVANTQVYVLNGSLQQAPVGVAGELFLGGVQVGRGYHNRPELTAEKFIPDPFRHEPDARLYRTGDLCRWLPDGVVEYLGRLDSQIKIRGLRVELGEIEAALDAHPLVGGSVVVAREDTPGDKRLVAYLVPSGLDVPPSGALRDHLRKTLPEYMVPVAFVTLDRFPLSPNGKVDRRALPAPPSEAVASPKAQGALPSGDIERAVAAAWREVLGIGEIDRDANFFDLGGDSLRLMRVCARLRSAFGGELDTVDMFRYPTVRTLAHWLGRGSQSGCPAERAQTGIEARREAVRRRRQRVVAGAEANADER